MFVKEYARNFTSYLSLSHIYLCRHVLVIWYTFHDDEPKATYRTGISFQEETKTKQERQMSFQNLLHQPG